MSERVSAWLLMAIGFGLLLSSNFAMAEHSTLADDIVPSRFNQRFLIRDSEGSFIPENFERYHDFSLEMRDERSVSLSQYLPSSEHVNKTQGYVIYGRRYHNPGGIPIVLAHGFVNNYWAMEAVGVELYKRGFDVFMYNHPGFGLTGERSYLNGQEPDGLGVAKLANAADLVIHFAHALTGKKVAWVGFSMGGMVLHQLVSGTIGVEKSGYPIRDPEVARQRRSLLRSGVAIGAPPYNLAGVSTHFQATGLFFQLLMRLGVLSDQSKEIPLGLGGPLRELARESALGRLIDAIPKTGIGEFLANTLISDMGDLYHFGSKRDQFKYIFAREFTNPTTGILDSFSKMQLLTVEPPVDAGSVPILEIIASKDKLANPSRIISRLVRLHAQNPQNAGIIMADTGHYHLVLPAIIDYYIDRLANFVVDAEGYQSKLGFEPIETIATRLPVHRATKYLESKFYKGVDRVMRHQMRFPAYKADREKILPAQLRNLQCRNLFIPTEF